MKLSLDWLSDFVTFTEKDPQKIAEALTLSVAEVEEVEGQGALLKHCSIGKVRNLRKHPGADRLSVCEVNTDRGVKKIVCGGTNLREGMLIILAHVGAILPAGGGELVELKKASIRGEESEGMICAAEEVELSDLYPPKPNEGNRPIVDLGDGEFLRGKSVREFLGLTDTIFHIDNHAITNRADLFSHVGFARECVAIGLGKWRKKPEVKPPKFGKGTMPFKFMAGAPKLMPRYLSALIEIDGIGETPEWMKKRLQAVGWRPLSLPIDITNYVATEIGVPLHSFDADDIVGTVHMRTSKKGEKIVTLDHQERELPEGGLVLSDDKGIFDLLGIMGGLRSSTKVTTKRMYLHSATLDPLSIRRTIIATGHRTDAATVYEKGVPPVTAEQGFYRAAQLMLELIPGARIVSKLESKGGNGKPKPIKLSLERASGLLGRSISSKEASKILVDLDCKVSKKGNALTVTPPLHRIGDLKAPVDLIEEIARVAGFKSFEEELPQAVIKPPKRDHRVNQLRDSLKESGFMETVQYAFLGEDLLKNAGYGVETPHFSLEALAKWDAASLREIENPFGEDMKFMRPSLLPRLLEYASENLPLCEGPLKIFEASHVFFKGGEHQSLALLVVYSDRKNLKEDPVLLAKEAFLQAVDSIGIEVVIEQETTPSSNMHPGRAARILLQGKKIGSLYEVHPKIVKNFDLGGRTAVAELNFDLLLGVSSKENLYEDFFTFPSITYDSTIILNRETPVEALLKKVHGFHEFLRDVKLVDLFEKEGKRHLTFRCTYNAGDRTLTEEEIKHTHQKVETILQGR